MPKPNLDRIFWEGGPIRASAQHHGSLTIRNKRQNLLLYLRAAEAREETNSVQTVPQPYCTGLMVEGASRRWRDGVQGVSCSQTRRVKGPRNPGTAAPHHGPSGQSNCPRPRRPHRGHVHWRTHLSTFM